ncbi:hypothetical protein MCAP1_001394 [Malassezia caprae]|uniref:PXA domain-containing protein n=1 Tax=Malassezia caprae TaxID=1381934 RepID=A0AAF0E9H3_9BASI|nr:hypothetical protein MCAP1_001394 [Malassezia caprae]
MDPSTPVAAAIAVLSVLVMRLGLTATLSVFALAFLLLCHPVVRVFFEMAVPDQGATRDSAQHDHETAEALRARAHGVTQCAPPRDTAQAGRMDLSSLPAALQPELRHLLRLVRADFVQYWYDPISFGSASFPDEAMASVEHLVAQVALRLEQYSRATVVTELSLTALSVLVTAMQNRRTDALPPRGLWPTTESRIQSLQTSVSTMLQQSLPPAERRSPLVVALLTDIFAKQLWDQLQAHSDPDVINQYIVLYGQVAAEKLPRAPREAPPDVPPPTTSARVGDVLDDLEHSEPRATPQSQSLPDDLTDVMRALKSPEAAEAAEPSSDAASLPADPWGSAPALPMDVPPGLPEAPWPPAGPARAEAHKYQVRLPKKVRDVLAQCDSDLYDEWYQYMQRRDPGAGPCEGAVLLQLRSNLEALSASFDDEASTPALYASDVKAVLHAAQSMLPSHAPCEGVRAAMERLGARETIEPRALEPLRAALLQRLQQLYDGFLCEAKGQADVPPSTFVPRVRPSNDKARQISVLDVSESVDPGRAVDPRTLQVLVTMEDAPGAGTGGYAVLRTWPHFEALHTELMRMYEKLPSDSGLVPPPPLPSLKGLASAAACEAIRQYLVALLVPAEDTLAWYNTTQAVQRFLDKTRAADEDAKLKNNALMSSLGGVSRSLASGLVGAAGTARKSMGHMAPAPSRASRIFGLRPDMSDTRRASVREAPELPVREAPELPVREAPELPPRPVDEAPVEAPADPSDAAPAAAPVEATAPVDPPVAGPPADGAASVQDVKALLTAVFAVTREALNMHEAWTVQRGMLRVMEQFLRTTYYGTVASLVTYLAGLLSIDAQVSWLQLLRTKLWPNDAWAGGQPGHPARSAADVRATAEAARAVVLSYAPPQAAYALGLGGKQAVADALATVHDVVTDPVVSLDLHLALLLRVLDLAMGTAGAPSGDRAQAHDSVAPRGDGYCEHPFVPQTDFLDHTVTNQARPLTSAVITVRIIKNFEYRTMKPLVLKDVDLTTLTARALMERCREEVAAQPAFRVYRNVVGSLDTLKIYTHAHGAKTTNLIINLDRPEWILDAASDAPLAT